MAEVIQLPYQWTPRDYQRPLFEYFQNGGRRAVTIWHRRAGKSYSTVNWAAMASQMRVGTILHVFPKLNQGRRVMWDGMDKKGRPLLSAFPDAIVANRNETEMRVEFTNGSAYQIAGTDGKNINSLIGSNPVGLIMDEYSLQNPRAYDFLRPILAENGGWVWFVYTPRGKNHGYTLYKNALENPNWYTDLRTVRDTGAISLEDIEEERRMGMSDQLIEQEFYCSWDSALDGAYYAKEMHRAVQESRITRVPWEPLLPVHTFWDIGVGDTNSIIFAQKIGFRVCIIDYYESTSEGSSHYAKVLKEKPYVYGRHWAPHDAMVTEWGTGKTRVETMMEHGIRFDIVPKIAIDDGIDAARSVLNKCLFDEVKCANLISALNSYTKEYDEDKQMFKNRPNHDWASNAADAFRYMATIIDDPRNRDEKKLDLPGYAKTNMDDLFGNNGYYDYNSQVRI